MVYFSKSTGGFYDESIHGKIPSDAVEVPDEQYAALMAAQGAGKVIQSDANGDPVAVEPPSLMGNDLIKHQITQLEATITPRRLRESVLGVDNGWLKNIDDQIAALRGGLI